MIYVRIHDIDSLDLVTKHSKKIDFYCLSHLKRLHYKKGNKERLNSIQKWDIYHFKIKIISFIVFLMILNC